MHLLKGTRTGPLFGHAQCRNCGQMVTVGTRAHWHSLTGCVSCTPVERDGLYSEPSDLWTSPRAAA